MRKKRTKMDGSTLDGNVYRAALCDECVSKAKEEKKIIQKAE